MDMHSLVIFHHSVCTNVLEPNHVVNCISLLFDRRLLQRVVEDKMVEVMQAVEETKDIRSLPLLQVGGWRLDGELSLCSCWLSAHSICYLTLSCDIPANTAIHQPISQNSLRIQNKQTKGMRNRPLAGVNPLVIQIFLLIYSTTLLVAAGRRNDALRDSCLFAAAGRL